MHVNFRDWFLYLGIPIESSVKFGRFFATKTRFYFVYLKPLGVLAASVRN
mgnify:CR=1